VLGTVLLPLLKLLTVGASAQVVGTSTPFVDSSLDLSEARLAIQGAVIESEDLLRENLLLKEQVRSLMEALAQSRIEADSLAVENKTLNLRVEAVGLDAAEGDGSKIEQRLVKALGDLRLAQNEASKSKETIAGLTGAVVAAMKTASDVDPEARVDLEAQLRTANQALGYNQADVAKAQAVAPTLMDARVISIKPELGLVVGNLGSKQGVKVGMPFRVLNGENEIARAHVVDVRDNICGALIEEQASAENFLKIGQRLRVASQNP